MNAYDATPIMGSVATMAKLQSAGTQFRNTQLLPIKFAHRSHNFDREVTFNQSRSPSNLAGQQSMNLYSDSFNLLRQRG